MQRRQCRDDRRKRSKKKKEGKTVLTVTVSAESLGGVRNLGCTSLLLPYCDRGCWAVAAPALGLCYHPSRRSQL